jgi:uncharacterized protein (TIGR02217 family)
MSFAETRLPLALAFSSAGGPERRTEVLTLASGLEQRNMRRAGSRRRWEIGGGLVRLDDAHALIAFFEARRGEAHGFRFRDPVDWKSCAPSVAASALDQGLGEGDGARTAFSLVKRYGAGPDAWLRRITKPVAGTVRVAVDGIETTPAAVDTATGRVTLGAPPAPGAQVTAGFEFDIPVRFDGARLETSLEGADAVRIGPLAVIELVMAEDG